MKTFILIAAGILTLALAVYLIYRVFEKAYERKILAYQRKLLQAEIEEVHNIYMTMRGWRHDYHNHMQSLKAYLAMDNVTEARHYLDGLEEDLDDINLLFNTGNLNADAVLNSKISLAIKSGIRVDYKAVIPVKLTISDIDLCVLIGNLIDNALEACRELPREERFIRLYIGRLKGQLYISVTNATAEPVRKLDDEYISRKRGDHGHGLKRINNIVDKYKGYINRKNEPGVFATEVMLPVIDTDDISCTN